LWPIRFHGNQPAPNLNRNRADLFAEIDQLFFIRQGGNQGGKSGEGVFQMRFSFKIAISLAPGFSPVVDGCGRNSRFNGLFAISKAAEAADATNVRDAAGLKPGANERNPATVI
jgi:hypothetical protein